MAAKIYKDFFTFASGGMQSGISPLDINKQQYAFGLNLSVRGGYIHTRPPITKISLVYQGNDALQNLVENGLFQGGGYYRPDFGTESLIAQISGHLIKFTENGINWFVTDISVPNDLNDGASTGQVWMNQLENYLLVTDGSTKLPIIYDGNVSRRSLGPSKLWGTTSADATPVAIGDVITVTLTSAYTGEFNVSVLFNGEFYQPISSGVNHQYSVILTNVSDTPGNTVPSGSEIDVIPSRVGYSQQEIDSNWQPPPANQCFPNGFVIIVAGFFANPVVAGQIILKSQVRSQIFTITAQGGLMDYNNCSPFPNTTYLEIFPKQLVYYANNTQPTVNLGNTVGDFTVPAIGSTVPVTVTQPYTGIPNQTVWINNQEYTIVAVPTPPPTTSLSMINLSDTQDPSVVITAGHTITSVPELPAGRMGTYGMEREVLCLVDGTSYIMGDLVGSASGTQANNFRDSVLKTTENDDLPGGGTFRLPGAGDIITAIVCPPNLDSSLGQGPCQIFTGFSAFSNNTQVDRTTWENATSPLQTNSLHDNGALGQNSTVIINSDIFFRSPIGIGSLVLARRDFGGWGNKPISNEMQRPLNDDNQSLLPFGSAMSFDNRYLATCAPNMLGRGVFHVGLVSLNFDLISSLRSTLPPAWESVWTGINSMQVIQGRVNGSRRAFSFTYNLITAKIELYEFLPEQTTEYLDNGVTPILSVFETGAMFNKDVKPMTDLCKLAGGKLYLSEIKGNVNVKVYWKPDFFPCWTLWRDIDLCEDVTGGDGNKKAGYRMPINLGEPPDDACEQTNNRPMNSGYFFQFRFEITGKFKFNGLFPVAFEIAQADGNVGGCEPEVCQVIDCVVPNDLQLYSLQGFLPVPPPPTPIPAPFQFFNQIVFVVVCGSGPAPVCDVAPNSLPDIVYNVPYSQQLTNNGEIISGWFLSGNLPAGITMDTNGLISGTSTQVFEATYAITLIVLTCKFNYTIFYTIPTMLPDLSTIAWQTPTVASSGSIGSPLTSFTPVNAPSDSVTASVSFTTPVAGFAVGLQIQNLGYIAQLSYKSDVPVNCLMTYTETHNTAGADARVDCASWLIWSYSKQTLPAPAGDIFNMGPISTGLALGGGVSSPIQFALPATNGRIVSLQFAVVTFANGVSNGTMGILAATLDATFSYAP